MNGRYYLQCKEKYLKLDLDIPYKEMLEEAKSLRKFFTPYRTEETNKGWHTLNIHGLGYDKGYALKHYGYTDPIEAISKMSFTEIADKAPATVDFLKNVYPSKRYGRVRFMLLEAGGIIDWHKDYDHSIVEAVNISLSNPQNCKWFWEDNTSVDFSPGNGYAMNLSFKHMIKNESDEDRYHLIIHQHDSTPEWMTMMERLLRKNNAEGNFVYSEKLD